MNNKTYIKILAKTWGGAKSEILEAKLHKLARSVINDFVTSKKPKEEPQVIKEERVPLSEEKKFLKQTIDLSIQSIIDSRINEYEKARMIVKVCRNFPEWHSITLIPNDVFNYFWGLYEAKKSKIIFDEDRDLQYFKVL